ncbi:hypothetical protein [Streptomyces sp. NPDC059761]|uniref:hypothetical protein n=1 Tax=Streptomyces sp. NPDC059761 TaxID=3346937 RepID=UPI00364C38DE
MEQRISLVTLGAADLARAKSFYAALGWRGTEVEETVFHRPAALNAIGFCSGVFTDPDGHAWEVAHNPGFTLTEDGSLVLPDFDG